MVDRKDQRTTPGSARLGLGISRGYGLLCRAPDLLGIRCDDERGRRRFFAPTGKTVADVQAAATERDRHELEEHGLVIGPPIEDRPRFGAGPRDRR